MRLIDRVFPNGQDILAESQILQGNILPLLDEYFAGKADRVREVLKADNSWAQLKHIWENYYGRKDDPAQAQ